MLLLKSIFDETTMGGLKMKNRLVRSATGEALATEKGNIPKDLFDSYVELAKGGSGMIIFAFTSVAPVDFSRDGLFRLHDDSLIPEYRSLVDEVHKYDCVALTQLALGIYLKQTESGSLEQLSPDQMTVEDIKEVINNFISAAVRAKKAGFDGIQLHGGHGFVLSRFISPLYNHRTDEYGGSTKGRAKIILDIIKGIREMVGDIHISIKINSSDFISGGLMPEESLIICKLLEDEGINSIEVSGNEPTVSNIKPMDNEGFFAPFAVKLQSIIKIPVIVTGGHRSVENMNKLLNEDGIEYFSLSRPLIKEPNLPNRWKEGDLRPSTCISCNKCFQTYGHKCIFNEGSGRSNRSSL
jgi:2,4-dienoyl-CoA reductase-like NADH-dependent reductase (Old Yellow Enzyme family)